jgi:hypothetical protein
VTFCFGAYAIFYDVTFAPFFLLESGFLFLGNYLRRPPAVFLCVVPPLAGALVLSAYADPELAAALVLRGGPGTELALSLFLLPEFLMVKRGLALTR